MGIISFGINSLEKHGRFENLIKEFESALSYFHLFTRPFPNGLFVYFIRLLTSQRNKFLF